MTGLQYEKNIFVLIFLFCLSGCSTDVSQSVPETKTITEPEEFPLANWQQAYKDFLADWSNYNEDEYYAGGLALFDLDNNSIPELILIYYDGIQGGCIFANIYSYNGDVIVINMMNYSKLERVEINGECRTHYKSSNHEIVIKSIFNGVEELEELFFQILKNKLSENNSSPESERAILREVI